MPLCGSKSKNKFYLEYAIDLCKYSNVMYNRHSCIIVEDGKIVAEGYNHYVKHFNHAFSMHAEIHAISKLPSVKKKKNNYEMYVIRVGTDNMNKPLKYSKPCINCTNAIIKAGIKKVYYSTNSDFENTYNEMYNKKSTSIYSN